MIDDRLALFELYTSAPNLPPENTIDTFREMCFDGIPDKFRAKSWKLLAQQIPFDNRKSWPSTLEGLRNTYYSFFDQFCVEPSPNDLKVLKEGDGNTKRILADMELLDQIDKDIRRTFSDIAFFQQAVNQSEECKIYHSCNVSKRNAIATWLRNYYTYQDNSSRRKSVSNSPNDFHWECMQRLLFIYAKVNPGLGYVQGMNYLLAPIYYVTATDSDKSEAIHAEADAFFLFNALMSHFRDLFTRSMDDINFNTNPDLKNTVDLISNPELYSEGNGVGHTLDRFQTYLKAVDETIFNDFEELLKADFSTSMELLQNYPVDVEIVFAKVMRLREPTQEILQMPSFVKNLKWFNPFKVIKINKINTPMSNSNASLNQSIYDSELSLEEALDTNLKPAAAFVSKFDIDNDEFVELN
ncbi:hypothetical protein HK103_003288 [Boothiomyces macroporosus]|uniref:Rab-GAP TBC domain-containing protein n=1 Tax=Boothiomyces macroporosus TaxID=261099 RepID=A0AAD5UC48_9FUNG|nr:hypothetical protein HK103_003288 [Boothiomyces macroporosus]